MWTPLLAGQPLVTGQYVYVKVEYDIPKDEAIFLAFHY